MTQHTPTPWKLGTCLEVEHIIGIIPADRSNHETIAVVGLDETESLDSDVQELPKANAKFIIRACNSHEALLVALCEYLGAHDSTGPCKCKTCERARAAIALVEGKDKP